MGGVGLLDQGSCQSDRINGPVADQGFHDSPGPQPSCERQGNVSHLADAAHDLHQEVGPVLQTPAPLVGAQVGDWGQELPDQVAVGGVDLDTVEADLLITPVIRGASTAVGPALVERSGTTGRSRDCGTTAGGRGCGQRSSGNGDG